MKNLRIDFLGGSFLRLIAVSVFGTELIISFKLGSFQLIASIFSRKSWKLLGLCRFHLYYKHRYIFHWCDLCVAPRIKGVNLGSSW